MHRVAQLVGQGEYRQALVRLWVLAGQHPTGTSTLNIWELNRNKKAFEDDVNGFRRRLLNEVSVSAAEIGASPLAFVSAIDEVLATLQTSMPFHPMPFEEEGVEYWLTRAELAPSQRVPFARQMSNREAWFKWHSITPTQTSHGIAVQITAASGRVAEHLAALARGKTVQLRGWVGHFEDDARVQFDQSAADKLWFRELQPVSARLASIQTTFEHAATTGCHVVVLPECTVDLAGRAAARDWIVQHPEHPFLLVVAGTFHEHLPDGRFSTAELWNHMAEPLLVHRKLRPFGSADGMGEDINQGNRLTVLSTPIGSVAVLICKDFLDQHPAVSTLLQEVHVEWALVPSYGAESTVAAHEARAIQLAKVGPGTSCMVANQRNVEWEPGSPLPGFAVCSQSPTVQRVEKHGGIVHFEVSRALPGPKLQRQKPRLI